MKLLLLIALSLAACGQARSELELQPSRVDAGADAPAPPPPPDAPPSKNFVSRVVESQWPQMLCEDRPPFGALEFALCKEAQKDGRFIGYICKGGGIASVPVHCDPAFQGRSQTEAPNAPTAEVAK